MNWTLWSVFATAGLLLDLTPGPAVLFVLATALRLGGRRAIPAILGILTVNALYFGLSATSVGAILAASPSVFFVAKWTGATYLLYLGLRALLARTSVLAAPSSGAAGDSPGRVFAGAFLTQASNPKAIVFFAAFVPQFVDPSLPIVRQMVILGATSTLTEFPVLLGYAMAAGSASMLAREPRYAVWTNRAAGSILVAAAIAMALLRR